MTTQEELKLNELLNRFRRITFISTFTGKPSLIIMDTLTTYYTIIENAKNQANFKNAKSEIESVLTNSLDREEVKEQSELLLNYLHKISNKELFDRLLKLDSLTETEEYDEEQSKKSKFILGLEAEFAEEYKQKPSKEAAEKALKELAEEEKQYQEQLAEAKKFLNMANLEEISKNFEAVEEARTWVQKYREDAQEFHDYMKKSISYIEMKKAFLTNALESYKKYFMIPNGNPEHLTKRILNDPKKVIQTRRGQIKTEEHYLTKDSVITYKGNDSTLTFTVGETKKLFAKKIHNGIKIFNFLLQKLNEQHGPEVVKFQLQELIDNGTYANKDSAHRGLNTVLSKIYAISVEGVSSERKGKKVINKTYAKSRIVSAYKVSYNECLVSLTPIIRESMKYITILPSWSYSLNENSYMLLDYIFYLARQNALNIKKYGHFNINLDTIRTHLALPTPEEAGKDPKKLIFDPIEKAIEEIEDARKGTDIKITPYYNHDYKHISEYLSGYIQIELDEYAQKYMEERAIAQEEQYKKAEKAKQKALEKAAKKELEKTPK